MRAPSRAILYTSSERFEHILRKSQEAFLKNLLAAAMTDVLAFHHVNDDFRHIGGMIRDALR